MALNDPLAENRLKRLLEIVNFYSENPTTEMFRGVKFSTWKLVLSLAFPEIFKDIQSPAGINQEVLFQIKETINNQLVEVALSKEQKENLETSLPPNLQELIDTYEKYIRSKNLTSEERETYLDDLTKRANEANQAVYKKWEEQRLENIRKALSEKQDALRNTTKEAAINAVKIHGAKLPELMGQEEDIAKIMTEIVEQVALATDKNGPKTKEDIITQAKPEVIKEVEKIIGNHETATSVVDLFLNDDTVQTIQTVSKLSFTENALLSQYEGVNSDGSFQRGIIPESLQNFSDKEIALLTEQITSPYQSGLSPKEVSSLQQQLFALIKREVILPYGQIETIATNKATQLLTQNNLVSQVEILLKNNLPLHLAKNLQTITINTSTIEILNAVRFSNWFFNKDSTNNGNPPGRLSIQERSTYLVSLQKLKSAISSRGTNDVFSTIETFIESNRNESWFKIISEGSSLLPNNPKGVGYALFSKLFKKGAEGYVQGPLSLFKTNVINFAGSLFTKAGTKLGNKFLLGIGAKILGVAAGGPIGAVIAFAPQILSMLEKISPVARINIILLKKAVKIISSALGGLLVYGLAKLASLGTAVTIGAAGGATAGAFIGSAAGPVGFVVGGIIGGIVGGIVGWITQSLTGGGAATAAAVTTPAAIGTSSTLSSIGAGTISSATMAAIPTAIATGATGILLLYTYIVSSTSLFVPTGEEALLGSPHITVTKKVNVGGLDNPNNIQNTVVGEKAIYLLSVGAKDIPLKDVTITDKTTITNKSGSSEFSNRYIAENQSGTYVFKEKITGEWNKTTDPQLQELTKGNTWNRMYGFTITNDMKDSFISNTVTVTGLNDQGGTETKSITLNFSIGTPPLPPASLIAKNLIDRLSVGCYGANIQRKIILQNPEKQQCIVNASKYPSNPPGSIINFKQLTADTIYNSTSYGITTEGNLQCVGFVQAVLSEAGQPLPAYVGQGNGADFFGNSPGEVKNNYTWHSSKDIRNIKSGDVYVSRKTTEGHIAIVYTLNNSGFFPAEALGDSAGQGHIQYSVMRPFSDYENDPNIGFWRYNK